MSWGDCFTSYWTWASALIKSGQPKWLTDVGWFCSVNRVACLLLPGTWGIQASQWVDILDNVENQIKKLLQNKEIESWKELGKGVGERKGIQLGTREEGVHEAEKLSADSGSWHTRLRASCSYLESCGDAEQNVTDFQPQWNWFAKMAEECFQVLT